MRQLFAIAGTLVLLAACDHFDEDKAAVADQTKKDAGQLAENTEKSAVALANTARDNVKRTAQRVRKWIIEPLPEEKSRLAVKSSYCYSAYQDILCYRSPMPGWEHRLVGYQGTGAAPPPPAVMQLLPTQAVDESQLPSHRLAGAAPVFKEMPQDSKEAAKESAPQEAPPADAAHETLPDPALAPQL